MRSANRLVLYVHGSQVYFNHCISEDSQNCIMGFDIKDLGKDKEEPLTSITLEQITDAVAYTVNDGALVPEKLAEFQRRVISLFESFPKTNDISIQ